MVLGTRGIKLWIHFVSKLVCVCTNENDCFRREELESVLPEGLSNGMLKEFGDSMRDALLIRQSFLDLRDNFRSIVDPTMQSNAKGASFIFLV